MIHRARQPREIAPASDPDRANWPTLTATVVITVLFGVFGVIPAYMHTEAVRKSGAATSRYWKAFGLTMVASVVAYILLIVGLFAILAASA